MQIDLKQLDEAIAFQHWLPDGKIGYSSAAFNQWLAYPGAPALWRHHSWLTPEQLQQIDKHFADPAGVAPEWSLAIDMPVDTQRYLPVTLHFVALQHQPGFIAVLQASVLQNEYLTQLQVSNQIMYEMLSHASEAFWCIEFTSPVDLNQPREQVISQIFEYEKRWRQCNPALAALYKLPIHIDVNDQPVSLYWPRSPENEKFINDLIGFDFSQDGVISKDCTHDGKAFLAENDVRSMIVDRKLYRMWGSIREISHEPVIYGKSYEGKNLIRDLLNFVDQDLVLLNKEFLPIYVSQCFYDRYSVFSLMKVTDTLKSQETEKPGKLFLMLDKADGSTAKVSIRFKQVGDDAIIVVLD